MSKLKVGIVGASGYSGEELVRLLARHPQAELAAVTSRSLAGTKLINVLPALKGLLDESLAFTASEPSTLAADPDIDLFFLALPHGVAAEFALPIVAAGKKVIDLSADFRLGSTALYKEFYGQEHPAPELLEKAAYVIPELCDFDWKSAPLIASPGCYPTSIQMPLVPLLRAGIISKDGIIANSLSGVSGAGKKTSEALLYCERTESAKAYGLPKHRHLSEIEEQLSLAAGATVIMQFNPHLAPMKRGIISTISVPALKSLDELYAVWEKAFAGKVFANVLPSGQFPDSAHVTRTNRVDMSAVLDERTGRFVITSAEDNLTKGASGQAVQIMNLWCGFEESAGLL